MHLHRGLRNFTTNFLFAYDVLYFVQPTGKSIESDGFRDTNKEFQEKIHNWFSEELDEALDSYYRAKEEYSLDLDDDKIIIINSDEVFDDPLTTVKRIYSKCFS